MKRIGKLEPIHDEKFTSLSSEECQQVTAGATASVSCTISLGRVRDTLTTTIDI